jgi:hypothetical protein
MHLDNLVKEHFKDNVNDFIPFKESFHKDLLFNTSYYPHPLYELAYNFDANGIQKIENISATYSNINTLMELKKKEIKGIYKILYKEDLITK